MSKLLKKNISSNDSINIEKFLLILMAVSFLLLMGCAIYRCIFYSKPFSLSGFIVLSLLLLYLFYEKFRLAYYLKYVFINEENLYVSNSFKEIIIPFTNIYKIRKLETYRKKVYIEIRTKHKSKFGKKFVFIAKDQEIYQELIKLTELTDEGV
ncbi:MAG: hypothetical protein ABIK92_17130 [Pseudomonadota bacterium]